MPEAVFGNMAGWFSKVGKGNSPADAEPVVYRLTCDCGGVVTGLRHEKMLVAGCKKCAEQLFVLPISPYPRPKKAKVKKTPPQAVPSPPPLPRRQPEEHAVEEPPKAILRSSLPKLPRQEEEESRSFRKPKSSSTKPQLPPAVPASVLRKPASRIVTPLSLLGAAMVLLLTGTIWWGLHRQAVQRAALVFADESRAGKSAMIEQDFQSADIHFQKAVQALNLLDRNDHEAREARQLAAETQVANQLALVGLFDLISEARLARRTNGPDWNKSMQQSYNKSWLLFDTSGMEFTSETDAEMSFALTLVPGPDPVQVRGNLSRFREQLGQTPPAKIIFAAQIQDIRSQSSGGWEILLLPDTLTLWATEANYSALGLPVDEQTRSTLQEQAKLLGLEKVQEVAK